MALRVRSIEQIVSEAKIAIKTSKNYNGSYNDRVCWQYMRQAFSNVDESILSIAAERVKIAMA